MKAIKLCADDFGLNQPVSDAIVSLVRMKRLNAISCMSAADNFAVLADTLQQAVAEAGEGAEIGLHIVLTEYRALSDDPKLFRNGTLPGIGTLMRDSFAGRIDKCAIESEIRLQFDRFEQVLGRKPDFVDGHQHAHLLPGIRDAFLSVAAERLSVTGWVRNCVRPVLSILETGTALPRTLLIAQLGRPLMRALKAGGRATNACFFGVNDFRTGESYSGLMRRWLAGAANCAGTPLIMCHPGLEPDTNGAVHDPISARRPDEYAYLSSPQFADDLKEFGLTLSRR